MKKLWLILLYFFVFASTLAFLIPPFEANDEPDHLAYINFIAKNRMLPVQTVDSLRVNKEGHQFPLYYFLSSLMLSTPVSYQIIPNKNNINYGGKENLVPVYNHTYNEIFKTNKDKFYFYLLRIFQILIAVFNLFFVYKIAGFFFKEEKFKLLTVFIVAAIPQFAFISSYIGNDGLANLISTLLIFSALNMLSKQTVSNIIIFGIMLALGIIIKKTVFFFLPALLIIFSYGLISKKMPWKTFFRILVFGTLSVGIISLWFFIRNYSLYNDIFLSDVEMNTVPYYVDPKSIFSFYFLYPFIPGLFGSFWGVFGWMNVALPFFIYVLLFLFCSMASYFAVIKIKKSKFNDITFLFGVLSVFFCLGGIIYYNTIYSQHQGRFLFPVISFIIIFLVYGIKVLYEKLNRNNLIMLVTALFFVFIDIMSIITIRNFYYDPSKYL